MTRVRIAAAGDLHADERVASRIDEAFEHVADAADIVLLAGDLTAHGEPHEMEVVARACARLGLPVYTVLGNHDHHANRVAELTSILEAAGVVVMERTSMTVSVNGTTLGIAGTKGFVGGFPGSTLPDFGEPLLREVYAETSREVEALEEGLEAIAGCERRLVLLHYAPVSDTLVCEPEGIWAFLGSGRLAGPIGAHRPDAVFHGHAHHGRPTGTIGSVPVHNVARHVSGSDFAIVRL
jgi:Icc-related predicted phosphoesterase